MRSGVTRVTRASLAAMAAVLALSAFERSPLQLPARSGFNTADFDTSVRPQDDLYRYVNGRWLDRTPMPDDRVSHTAATELVEKTNEDIRAVIEELAASGDRRPGSPAQQVADLYASMMNEAAIEARGIAPLQPELAAIDAIDSTRALAGRAGRLSSTTTSGPFSGNIGQGLAAATVMLMTTAVILIPWVYVEFVKGKQQR